MFPPGWRARMSAVRCGAQGLTARWQRRSRAHRRDAPAAAAAAPRQARGPVPSSEREHPPRRWPAEDPARPDADADPVSFSLATSGDVPHCSPAALDITCAALCGAAGTETLLPVRNDRAGNSGARHGPVSGPSSLEARPMTQHAAFPLRLAGKDRDPAKPGKSDPVPPPRPDDPRPDPVPLPETDPRPVPAQDPPPTPTHGQDKSRDRTASGRQNGADAGAVPSFRHVRSPAVRPSFAARVVAGHDQVGMAGARHPQKHRRSSAPCGNCGRQRAFPSHARLS